MLKEKQPIRILQIVPNMQSGGLETLIMNIYRNINREHIQFDFLVHYKEKKFFDDEIESLGGKIYRFSLRDDNNILKYIYQLNKFYKAHKEYKVIHCHMSSIGFINFFIAKFNGIKVRIAHSHNNSTDKTLKGKIKNLLIRPYKFISTLNFACSNSAGKFLFGNKKFEVVPNAIDIELFKYNIEKRNKVRNALKIGSDTFVVGHVGRFNVQKNHKFIIEIFREIKNNNDNSILILVGSGELENNIKELVKKYKLEDSVIFMGNRADVYELYQCFDCFLFPSLFEGLGITLIEAQISGLKCYTSKDVVAKEAKITNNIEYIDLSLTANEWATKILANSSYERIEHSKAAIDNGFDIKMLGKKMENLYSYLYKGGEY